MIILRRDFSDTNSENAYNRLHRQIQPETTPFHSFGSGMPAGKSKLKVRVKLYKVQRSKILQRLSSNLVRRIEEFDNTERKDVVSGVHNGCAPLFMACKNGSAEVVEYLITKCNAPIEQKGLFEVEEEGVRHSVTPLWCAAVSGRLAVVRVLLR